MQRAKRYIMDIILIALVLSSLVMVCRIWFGKYISPDTYNDAVGQFKSFISSPFSWLSRGKLNTFSHNIKILIKPEKIVANYSGNRTELTASDDEFEDVKNASSEFLSQMFSGEAKILEKNNSTEEEYFTALKGKSLFVSYGNKLDARLISMSICGNVESKIKNDVSELKDILIVFNDNVLNNVFVYIMETKTGNILKYSVEYNKAKLDNALKGLFEKNSGEMLPSYSFELNFHKSTEGSMAKVLFAPTILLEVTPKKMETVSVGNIDDFSDEYGINASVENSVLRTFKINPQTMRKFTDVSGSVVFVENYGTLIIDPKGSIEFNAVEGRGGIALVDGMLDASYDIYKTTTLAVDFISSVCAAFPNNIMESLQISSDIVSGQSKPSRQTLKFDYYIDGAPVFIKTDNGPQSAIEMVIENGKLLFYRQHLKEYYKTEEEISGITSINAADKIVENTPEDELPIYVRKMGTCFVDDGSKRLSRKWRFEIDGRNEAVLVD